VAAAVVAATATGAQRRRGTPAGRPIAANNPALAADISATTAGGTIAATVPAGADATDLDTTFATTGRAVTISGTAQISGRRPTTSPIR